MVEEVSILVLEKYKIEEKGKKGNDSMNLQKMDIEELKSLQAVINQEMKIREEKLVDGVIDEFLIIWKKMEHLGIKLRTEDIGNYTGGQKISELQIAINDKEISIY